MAGFLCSVFPPQIFRLLLFSHPSPLILQLRAYQTSASWTSMISGSAPCPKAGSSTAREECTPTPVAFCIFASMLQKGRIKMEPPCLHLVSTYHVALCILLPRLRFCPTAFWGRHLVGLSCLPGRQMLAQRQFPVAGEISFNQYIAT